MDDCNSRREVLNKSSASRQHAGNSRQQVFWMLAKVVGKSSTIRQQVVNMLVTVVSKCLGGMPDTVARVDLTSRQLLDNMQATVDNKCLGCFHQSPESSQQFVNKSSTH